MIPGSIEPARVPIIRPSSGVIPIEVSTDRPPIDRGHGAAAAEMGDDEARGRRPGGPSSSAARRTDHATDSPWKP